MKRIALSMIVDNETDSLDRCLKSIIQFVDGIYILQTSKDRKTYDICKNYQATVIQNENLLHTVTKEEIDWLKKFFGYDPINKIGDKLFLFDRARNIALSMIPKDYKYFLWLDADDVFRGGQNVGKLLDHMDQKSATAIFMNYLYDVELNEQGQIRQVLIEHLRERILLNDGRYKWIAPIHETLIAQSGEIRQIETRDCDVVHLSTRQKKEGAIWRNIKVLEKSIFDTKGKDPRPLYYLAKVYYDLHTPENYIKAENLIFLYLQGESPSGWQEERAQAYEYLAEIYRGRKHFNKAIKACLNALVETNKFPSTYLSLAVSEMYRQNWEGALIWIKLAGTLDMPKTTLVVNPRDMIARTLEVLMNCNLKLSRLDEAWAASVKLKELFPADKGIDDFYNFLTGLKTEKELTKHYIEIAKYIQDKDQGKLQALISSTPSLIENNAIIADFIKRHRPPKTWEEKEVAIYCGPGFTPWNPNFLKRKSEGFVGGSEEAVMYSAKALTDHGWKVTIYADPGIEGDYEGVTYLNHYKFNHKDQFNILIAWRQPAFFEFAYNAKKTYLWLHDVPNPFDFKESRLKNITKIWCLSKAQRECLPNIPDEKIFITSNGFVEIFPKIKPENDPHTCIWTSSYDRGLIHLLEIWPEVKIAVPQANLHIFYGWMLFDKFYANNPERMAWKKRIEEMMKYEGITHHGRVEQSQMEIELKKSGVWAYPTDFYEINCISAIKAQAFGAVPLTMNYAALKEIVQYGLKIDGDIWDKEIKEKYKQALINILGKQAENKEQMIKWAKDKYSWTKIVHDWAIDFNK